MLLRRFVKQSSLGAAIQVLKSQKALVSQVLSLKTVYAENSL